MGEHVTDKSSQNLESADLSKATARFISLCDVNNIPAPELQGDETDLSAGGIGYDYIITLRADEL